MNWRMIGVIVRVVEGLVMCSGSRVCFWGGVIGSMWMCWKVGCIRG